MNIELITMDMDGTIITDGWHYLTRLLVGEGKRQNLYDECIHQPHLFQEWVNYSIEKLIGKDLEEISGLLLPPAYTPGFEEFCRYAQGRGIKIGIASAGITIFSDYIIEEHHLDFAVANTLVIKKGKFTGESIVKVDLVNKGEIVKQLMEQYGVSPKKTIHLGDFDNDIPAWEVVGHPLGMNLKHKKLKIFVKDYFQSFQGVTDYLKKNK